MRPRLPIIAFGAIVPLACLSTSSASAAAPPRYDVNGYCKEIAGVGGTYSEESFGACMDEEQHAYDALKPKWNGFPAAMRDYCNEIATVGGAGSYESLKTCLEEEARSAKKNNTKTFHY
jgi:hypothetical protein